MKITIANWDARPEAQEQQSKALAAHVARTGSGLVLLPEMPFTPWLALSPDPVQAEWEASVAAHDAAIPKLAADIGVAIAGSRPVVRGEARRNQAFLYSGQSYQPIAHEKAALPSEDGYWEAQWYGAGEQQCQPIEFGGIKLGFAICTELWDGPHSQRLARAGADVILAPRATPDFGDDIWVAGVRALAVQTGCYVLSSNFAYERAAGFTFEGLSAAADPDGILIGLCTADAPFVCVDISVEKAQAAKSSYPRYIFNI